MKSDDLISIIVPIYNVKKYLNQSIESIINQTYKNLEIILVDDGSNDGCYQICEEFGKKDKRIKIIHKENGGLSDARNVGIDNSKGKYLAFVDSDDYIDCSYIDKLYTILKEKKVHIAQCGFYKVDEFGNIIDQMSSSKFECVSGRDFIINMMENRWENVVVWNKLYDRNLFDNIRFPKGKIHEDEFTTYKLVNNNSVAILPICLYYYRQNNSGITRSEYTIKRLDKLKALYERYLFFKESNDKYLENLSLLRLTEICRFMYIYVYGNDVKDKEESKKYIINMYRRVYLKLLLKRRISLKIKIKSVLFGVLPNVYSNIKNTLRGVKDAK